MADQQQQAAAMGDLERSLRRARGRGVPLVAVTTPDQPAMVGRLVAAFTNGEPAAVLTWDAVRGPQAATEAGKPLLARLCGEIDPAALTDFPSMLALTRDNLLGTRVVVVVFNSHRYLDDTRCMQGVMNLRDTFAAQGAMIVLMAPSFVAPVELGSDVLVIDEPLPTDEERRELVAKVARDAEKAGAAPLTADGLEAAIRSTRGLPRFALSQTVSLSMAKTGLDEKELRSRFVQAVNSTPGLRYEPEPVGLDGIGGLDNFKDFARALAGGREPPDLVVRIDEIEKALAGSSGAVGDSSGTSQAILGALLTWMEEKRASGLIALGPPGAGKSLCSLALGAVLGVPTVTLDVGALKGSLVGQSEANVRAALKTLGALSSRTFFLATCNGIDNLPPELRRRFRSGVWFFDLPTFDERDAIWQLYTRKLDIADERPADVGWTGAEIRACCEQAWQLRISPREAAKWIVPVARAAGAQIEALRKSASGRYVSASAPGVYEFAPIAEVSAPPAATGRKYDFDN